MSTSQSRGYAQENWWGNDVDGATEDAEDDETEDNGVDLATKITTHQRDRAEWRAHDILTDVSTKVCGAAKKESRTVELSKPEYYPPTRERGRWQHGARINPEDGYITQGISTWVAFDELPRQEFLAVINDCIAWWNDTLKGGLSESDQDRIYQHAAKRKSQQDYDDNGIVAELILAVHAPDGIEAALN
jgi:hypothetical protein